MALHAVAALRKALAGLGPGDRRDACKCGCIRAVLALDAAADTAKCRRAINLVVAHNPDFKPWAQRCRPALALAMDALIEEGIDPNDRPEWPEELPPLEELKAALARLGMFDADVERAIAVVRGDLNDDPDVRQDFDPLSRLLAWLRDIKGVGDEAIAEIEQLLAPGNSGLSDIGAAVFEGAADGRFLTAMRERGDWNMSNYMEIRRAEAETGIDILAFDSEPSPVAMYRRALTELGVDHAGVYDLKALRGMLRMAKARAAAGSDYATDAAPSFSPHHGSDDWLKNFGVGA